MPPPAIVTTPGAADANSFADVAEYKVFWNSHLWNTQALAATDEQIAQALLTTGRAMNATFAWTGAPTDDVQAMTWPRNGMLTRNGFPIANTENPQDLKDAQCEWAGQYVAKNLFATNAILAQGIATAKAGPVAISYKNQSATSVDQMNADVRRQQPELAYLATAVPDAVRILLVKSWYTRELLGQPVVFEAHR